MKVGGPLNRFKLPIIITGLPKAALSLLCHLFFFVMWCASNEASFIAALFASSYFVTKNRK